VIVIEIFENFDRLAAVLKFAVCQNPESTDLVLNLSQDGIRLIFDTHLQTLKVWYWQQLQF